MCSPFIQNKKDEQYSAHLYLHSSYLLKQLDHDSHTPPFLFELVIAGIGGVVWRGGEQKTGVTQ